MGAASSVPGDHALLTLQPLISNLSSSPAATCLRLGPEGWGSSVWGQPGPHSTIPFPCGPPTGLSGRVQASAQPARAGELSLEMTYAFTDLLQTGFMKIFMNFSM